MEAPSAPVLARASHEDLIRQALGAECAGLPPQTLDKLVHRSHNTKTKEIMCRDNYDRFLYFYLDLKKIFFKVLSEGCRLAQLLLKASEDKGEEQKKPR